MNLNNTYNIMLGLCLFLSCSDKAVDQITRNTIDREELVLRHNVVITQPDTLGSLTVGNGEFAFTVDVSGLQTFPDVYENGISLGTQSQWGWHRFPSPTQYNLDDVAVAYESCDGTSAPYAIQHSTGEAARATHQLRTNPHRLHLGTIGLILLRDNGDEVDLTDLQDIHQELDLWTGKIETKYSIDGVPVKVVLYGSQVKDGIVARITSPMIQQGRLKIRFRFPYGKDCHTCPGYDFGQDSKHSTDITNIDNVSAIVNRKADTTAYHVLVNWDNEGSLFSKHAAHEIILTPSATKETFSFGALFGETSDKLQPALFTQVETENHNHWKQFWTEGAAIDFSECTDPRANELERRVVLSQYLTRIQCAGSVPPQETGLTMNSWYGKFHLEMHWWHAVHFALWNRTPLLEKSMPWYSKVIDNARATAQWQGYEGARWQKMTDPYGNESPSDIGTFLIWQQPHPIYYAELFYRDKPTIETLEKYKDIVFSTADFMASFVKYNEQDKKFHLCHPLIPAQEIFKPKETDNPPYELAYWHYALGVAQEWRQRLGLEVNEKWQTVIDNLAPLPVKDGLYLPTASVPDAYTNDQYRRDHPVVTAAYGFLPEAHNLDTAIMSNTFDEIMSRWQWETTWGWDYPTIAMCAARLGKPDQAINALLMDVQKNTYLVNGHNYQDKRLRLYLPGNGGLLAAIAMMAGGWDGSDTDAPGFPKDGKWNVKYEGFKKMP